MVEVPVQLPLQLLLHAPTQVTVQLPVQLPVQLEHAPLQPLHPVRFIAKISLGILANTTAPTTGNAAFAAFLKNSLRDWSLLFVFSFIAV